MKLSTKVRVVCKRCGWGGWREEATCSKRECPWCGGDVDRARRAGVVEVSRRPGGADDEGGAG